MGEEIVERAKQKAWEIMGGDDGEPEAGPSTAPEKGKFNYFPFYPKAWTEICEELDDETKNEYLELMDEWNKGVVPAEVQQKYVCSYFKL